MTKLLLRLFVKDHTNPQLPKVRSGVGRLSGFVGILCNLLLFGAKILVGTLSGSVSITADAMNNLTDATSSVVTLVGFKLAEKPADEDHPYGHARFEYLSGLAVAALILLIGFELGESSVEKILNPSLTAFSWITAVVLLLSIGVKLWLSLFNGKLGKLIGSTALAATAADSRNDCVATLAVLAAGIVEMFTSLPVDGYMGLAVAAFILYSGISLGKETISPLLGEAASPQLREDLAKLIMQEPLVLGYHDLMVHDYGPGQRFASIHVEMDQKEDPLHCHEIIDNLERNCRKELAVSLVIHYDPVVTDDPELNRLRQLVSKILSEYDNRLKIHDFRMARSTGHQNLIFDVALPSDLKSREKEIQEMLEKKLDQLEKVKYYTVITFDPADFNPGEE